MRQKAHEVVNEIFSLFEKYGSQKYGEEVTQSEHMSQAAILAQENGADSEDILAAFLHDIGHLSALETEHERMGELGMVNHEKHGADFLLERGFSEKVAFLVEGHVAAKRYLTWKKTDYYTKLSDASKQTLEFQGGPMSDEEGTAFEQHPLFQTCLDMRKWDDEAKIPGVSLHDVSELKTLMLKHLTS